MTQFRRSNFYLASHFSPTFSHPSSSPINLGNFSVPSRSWIQWLHIYQHQPNQILLSWVTPLSLPLLRLHLRLQIEPSKGGLSCWNSCVVFARMPHRRHRTTVCHMTSCALEATAYSSEDEIQDTRNGFPVQVLIRRWRCLSLGLSTGQVTNQFVIKTSPSATWTPLGSTDA